MPRPLVSNPSLPAGPGGTTVRRKCPRRTGIIWSWAYVHGRWNNLRDVAGGTISLQEPLPKIMMVRCRRVQYHLRSDRFLSPNQHNKDRIFSGGRYG